MKISIFRLSLIVTATLLFGHVHSFAVLLVNAPMTISHQVTVQLIEVSLDDGTNSATVFGDAGQSAIIQSHVNTIWSQAGIDINFLSNIVSYDNTFAHTGTVDPRPTSDLNTIISNAAAQGGILNSNSSVINMFMVNVVPGFSFTSLNSANGLAFVGGNGITQFVGSNLLTFEGGREVIASVVAHEIGHNLGLSHLVEAENLLQAGGSSDPGERLNASQISTAQGSPLAVAVPEPSAYALAVGLFSIALIVRRRPYYNASSV